MYLELYRNANAKDAFDHFRAQRESNVEYLRTLPRSAGERRARHQEAGEITLQQLLHEWTMHDLGHIRQIAELVRARKHLQVAVTGEHARVSSPQPTRETATGGASRAVLEHGWASPPEQSARFYLYFNPVSPQQIHDLLHNTSERRLAGAHGSGRDFRGGR
jgi:hypothetical protein